MFFYRDITWASLVSAEDNGDKFPLVGEKALPVYIGAHEDPGVVRAVKNFGEDVFRVTGKSPEISETTDKLPSRVVLVGTLGNNAWIDRLVVEGKLRSMILRDNGKPF